MKSLCAGLGALLLAALALAPRPALSADDPASFMNDLGGRVLKLVSDKQIPEAQRKQQFQQLVTEAFDMPKISQFVLGRYWRTADDAQRQQFQQAFQSYMVNTYWSRFNKYEGQEFKVKGQRQENNGATLVNSEVVQPNGKPPVKADWWVTKPGGTYKITDVSIEGVSQAITYRQEFASVIERNGGQIAALTDQLRQKQTAEQGSGSTK